MTLTKKYSGVYYSKKGIGIKIKKVSLLFVRQLLAE